MGGSVSPGGEAREVGLGRGAMLNDEYAQVGLEIKEHECIQAVEGEAREVYLSHEAMLNCEDIEKLEYTDNECGGDDHGWSSIAGIPAEYSHKYLSLSHEAMLDCEGIDKLEYTGS